MAGATTPRDQKGYDAAIDSLLAHLNDALEIADQLSLSAVIAARIQHAIDTCLSETQRETVELRDDSTD